MVINKIDIPEVRERLDTLLAEVRAAAGHSRVLGISAATQERTAELMTRVRRLVTSLPQQSDYELFTEEESRVRFDADEEGAGAFEVLKDERFPGQFRVAGERIEKVQGYLSLNTRPVELSCCCTLLQIVEMTNWDYYEAVQRFQRILEAQGVTQHTNSPAITCMSHVITSICPAVLDRSPRRCVRQGRRRGTWS